MTQKSPPKLELEYQLNAPPEKVWRAISTPTLRQQWLPDNLLATAEPLSARTIWRRGEPSVFCCFHFLAVSRVAGRRKPSSTNC